MNRKKIREYFDQRKDANDMVTALGVQEICAELHLGLSFDDVLSYISLVDNRQRLELSYA